MSNRKPPLTEPQKRVYGFVVEFIRENKYPPTIREIQNNFDFRSSNSVVAHIKKLKQKGYLTNKSVKGKMTARTIQIVDDVVGYHAIKSEDLSKALSYLKRKGHNIGAQAAVELLSVLHIKIE